MEALSNVMKFVMSYHAELDSQIESRGRHRFFHHGEKTTLVIGVPGRDGCAVLYFPPSGHPKWPDGYCGLPGYAEFDLNTICQSLSLHRLKIISPDLGSSPFLSGPIPPDTAPIRGLFAPFIHDDVRKLAVEGKLKDLAGVSVVRPMRVANGLCIEILSLPSHHLVACFGISRDRAASIVCLDSFGLVVLARSN